MYLRVLRDGLAAQGQAITALPRSPTYATWTKPFCAHFAQFLSSLAFDKKTTALRRSFLVPTFVYRHRSISHLVIRMPVSSMTETPAAGRAGA
jgi:hypothetical protein